MEVNLRTIECTVAFINNIVQPHFLQSVSQAVGSQLPILVRSHGILRSGRQLYEIFKAKKGINLIDQSCNVLDLLSNLLLSHKDMGVVLGKAAHTHQTMKLSALLMTVNQTQFAYSQRKISVGTRLRLVHQHTAGAVHWLNCVVFLIDHSGIHIILIVIPVTGGLPQLAA